MGNKNATLDKSCPKCHRSLDGTIPWPRNAEDFTVCTYCNSCIHECADSGYSVGSMLNCKKCLDFASRTVRKSNNM